MKWDTVKLGEVSNSIQTGPFGSQLHQSDYSANGIPVVMPKDIIDGHISETSIARVSAEQVERLSRHKIESGDILYSRRGDVGRCAYASDKEMGWLCGTGCLKVSVNPKMANSKFIFYQLQQPKTVSWIINHAVGATMLNLNTSILSALPLELPSLDIQMRSVDILSAYDDLIENNQKQIKLLEEAAQRLYKEWFVDFRFPGHETAKFINGLPEGWRKDTINSQIHLLSGYAFKSSVFNKFGKYKIITIKNVKDGKFDNSNVNHLDAPPDNMPKHCHLKDGDILLSLTGNVGRVCIVVGDGFLMNQRVAKIESTIPAYAYFLFRSDRLFNEINSLANGVAQQNLSPVRTGKIKVCYPSDDILQRFEKIVEPIINRTIALSKKNSILTEARDRLLPKLINGEIEV